jgi:hypothetical protein
MTTKQTDLKKISNLEVQEWFERHSNTVTDIWYHNSRRFVRVKISALATDAGSEGFVAFDGESWYRE